MSILPLSSLLRSYFITSVSSYPLLLRPSLAILNFLAHAQTPILNPDRNPALRYILKKTFYAQFCAGETPTEVSRTLSTLKSMGYAGVILGHAKEVVMSASEAAKFDETVDCAEQEACNKIDIATWKTNTIATIDLAQKGDFVGLKFSGAGRQALKHLRRNIPCAPAFEEAVHEMCVRAEARGVGLLFDAEQDSIQDGIDSWTMYFARRYNKGGRAVVYGTYQAYKRKTPEALAKHLALAREEGFVLGVKLVRGAYLGSDPRELFWSTIEDTHACYDGCAKAIMQRQYNDVLRPIGEKAFPEVDLVLAGHNIESVRKAKALRAEQAENGIPRIRLAYGQLMGMADNVSCELVKAGREAQAERDEGGKVDVPRAYKYVVWGKMGVCMQYLLRRAQENRDAVSRTVDARKALGKELGRRMGFGGSG
jgi:proline dehydrogenase